MDVVKISAYLEWLEVSDGHWVLFRDGEILRPGDQFENELLNACRARWSIPAPQRPLSSAEIEDVRRGLLDRNCHADKEDFHE